MGTNDWTAALKPGDKVAIRTGTGLGRSLRIRTLAKITKTQFVIDMNNDGQLDRFNRNSLRRSGSDAWSRTYLVELTPDVLREAEMELLQARLSTIWGERNSLTFEQLRAIVDAYDAVEVARHD